MIRVPSTERQHRPERWIEVDVVRCRDRGNDEMLRVALAQHNEPGEVQLRVCTHRFTNVRRGVRGSVGQGGGPHDVTRVPRPPARCPLVPQGVFMR